MVARGTVLGLALLVAPAARAQMADASEVTRISIEGTVKLEIEVAAIREPMPPATLRVTRTETHLLPLDSIFFAENEAEPLPASRIALDAVAAALRADPTLRLRIEAHTDSVAPDPYNLRLSSRRAWSVLRYLERQGIDGWRLSSLGLGAARPVASNATEVGRQKNRRVEFVIAPEDELAP